MKKPVGLAYSVCDMKIHSEYSHRAVSVVLDGLDFNFSSTHRRARSILSRQHPKTRLATPDSVGGWLERKWRARWQEETGLCSIVIAPT